jgi:ATP-dependent DNA ligase
VLVQSVKEQGFEGLVAKRRNSVYEPGLRTGAWMKMRVNRGQEFVIGGYTRGTKTFDALISGYYEGEKLIYVARTRNGFTPVKRAQLFKNSRDSRSVSARLQTYPRRRAVSGVKG